MAGPSNGGMAKVLYSNTVLSRQTFETGILFPLTMTEQHVEFLSLQSMFPLKAFDEFEGLDAFRFLFKHCNTHTHSVTSYGVCCIVDLSITF